MKERAEEEVMDEEEYFVRFAAGDDVFREGEPGNEMFIVREGQVEILKQSRGSDRRLAVLGEGDFFGEMAILEDLPRFASARALCDCVLLRIEVSTFGEIVRHNPEIAVRMLRKLSRRLRQANPLLLEVDVDEAAVLQQGSAFEEGDTEPIPVPPPLPSERAVPRSPRLVHEPSGTEFLLAPRAHTYIGRHDAAAGITPDVDLLPVDDERTISRRHAKIIHRDGKFFLCEEVATANGTFVNHKRLSTDVEVEIEDGDELGFGMLRTVFRTR